MYCLQSSPLSSFQPMKGDTKSEPFFAAKIACEGANTSVRFVLMPSFSSCLAAAIPASVAGILMAKFGETLAYFFASATISSVLSRCGLISIDTGNLSMPSRPFSLIQLAMSVMAVTNGFPLSMMCLGLVVTPSIPNVL